MILLIRRSNTVCCTMDSLLSTMIPATTTVCTQDILVQQAEKVTTLNEKKDTQQTKLPQNKHESRTKRYWGGVQQYIPRRVIAVQKTSPHHPKSAPGFALVGSNTPSVPLDRLRDLRPVHTLLPENQIPQHQISIFGPERFLVAVDNNDAIPPASTRRRTTTLSRGRREGRGNRGGGSADCGVLVCARGHG